MSRALTDAAIAEKGARYLELSSTLRIIKAERDAIKKALLAEFDRRDGTKSIEHAGITVTRKASRRRRWLTAKAQTVLSAGRFRALTVRTLDPDAVTAAHEAGRLTDDELAQICETYETAPYIVVTIGAAE